MIKFEVGKTYGMRSICDHNCTWNYEVLKRTAKTITIEVEGKNKACRIKEYDGAEMVHPLGKYSMCPSLRANRGKQ